MSDDAVVLPPGGRMIRGSDGIERVYVAAGGPQQGSSNTTVHQVFRY